MAVRCACAVVNTPPKDLAYSFSQILVRDRGCVCDRCLNVCAGIFVAAMRRMSSQFDTSAREAVAEPPDARISAAVASAASPLRAT